MGSLNLVVVVESIRNLVTKHDDDLKEFHLPSIIAVAVAFGIVFPIQYGFGAKQANSCQVRPLRLLLLFEK